MTEFWEMALAGLQVYVTELWKLLVGMSLYLLMGFALAGVLRAFMPSSFARNHLAGGRKGAVLKASLMGVPMPLCSCSVLPVANHLRKSGAGPGATGAFLTSTPATGAEAITATYAILGPVFAVIMPVYAMVSGLLTGWWIQWGLRKDTSWNEGVKAAEETNANTGPREAWWQRLRAGLAYGFGDLLRDTRKWLIIGLLLGALITTLIPDGALEFSASYAWLGYLAVMAVAIPTYVCSMGSLPVGAALLAKGLSPGAVFLFLSLGPAVSTATIAFVFGKWGKAFGWRWMSGIAVLAMLTAVLIDAMPREWFTHGMMTHQHGGESLWEALGVVAFLLVLLRSWWGDLPWTRGHAHGGRDGHDHAHDHDHDHSHSVQGSAKACAPAKSCCGGSCDPKDSDAGDEGISGAGVGAPSGPVVPQEMIYHLHIPDMTCGNCLRTINNALAFGGGTVESHDLDAQTIDVRTKLQEETLRQLLSRAGYPPAQG